MRIEGVFGNPFWERYSDAFTEQITMLSKDILARTNGMHLS